MKKRFRTRRIRAESNPSASSVLVSENGKFRRTLLDGNFKVVKQNPLFVKMPKGQITKKELVLSVACEGGASIYRRKSDDGSTWLFFNLNSNLPVDEDVTAEERARLQRFAERSAVTPERWLARADDQMKRRAKREKLLE